MRGQLWAADPRTGKKAVAVRSRRRSLDFFREFSSVTRRRAVLTRGVAVRIPRRKWPQGIPIACRRQPPPNRQHTLHLGETARDTPKKRVSARLPEPADQRQYRYRDKASTAPTLANYEPVQTRFQSQPRPRAPTHARSQRPGSHPPETRRCTCRAGQRHHLDNRQSE